MYVFQLVFRNCSQIVRRGIYLLGLLLVLQAPHFHVMGQIGLSEVEDQFGRTEQHFPQVVLNQGSTTFFSIYNPSSTDIINVDVQLYFPSGDPLANQQVELGPGGTQMVSFGESDGVLTRG